MIRAKRHPSEPIAVDTLDTVEPGQPLVDKGVTGIEQFQQTAIFADAGTDEQLRFPAERFAQVLVELGILR